MAGYLPSAHRKLKEKDPQAYETLAEASNGIVVRKRSRLPHTHLETQLTVIRRPTSIQQALFVSLPLSNMS